MVLLLLCSAQFVTVLDVTIVAVALPAIQDDLGFSGSGLQWVVTAYTLAFGGLLVSAGRAADLFGRRRLFAAGLALFAAASAGCALATTPAALVVTRAVQGVGAALLAPAALALVTDAYPEGRARHRALAIWTAAAAGGGATGWVAGGLLTESLGWQAVFAINVPVGIAGVALARRILPAGRGAAAARGGAAANGGVAAGRVAAGGVAAGAGGVSAARGGVAAAAARLASLRHAAARLDAPGAALVTGGLVLLVLGLTHAEAGRITWPLIAAPVLLAAFAVAERHAAHPLLPPRTFADRGFSRAALVALALTASTTPAMLLSILHQQQELGRSATETGLACVPFNVAVIAGSLLAGRIRAPHTATMAAGLAGVTAGALLIPAALIAGYAVMGASLGAASVASTAAGTSGAQKGVSSGVLTAAAQIGPALGLAVATSFTVAAAIALAAILPALAQPRTRSKQSESAQPAYAPQHGRAT